MEEPAKEWQQRNYPRVKESCRVKYHVIEEAERTPEKQNGVAVNISGGGMCFSADRELRQGTMVALEITLNRLPTPVLSLARVVWCEEAAAAGKFDVGVEFWWIGWADQEAQNQMLKYINKKLEQLGGEGRG